MNAADRKDAMAGRFDRIAARAKREAEAKSRSRSARRERPARAKGATKAERKVEHRVSTAVLRGLVWERCAGRDEATGDELGAAWEMHHVEGAGLRRSRQHLGNVLAVSWETHRRAHRGDLGTLELIARAPTLDDTAKRAALYRVAKVNEARRQPSVPVEIRVSRSSRAPVAQETTR